MKETRVSKYQQYRNSISKGESKRFFATQKPEEVSTEMGLFLKMKTKKRVENIVIIAICLLIVTLLLIFGLKLF